jgi:hypothetical protein
VPRAYAVRSEDCRTQRHPPFTDTACIVAVVIPSSDVTRTVTAFEGKDFEPTVTGSS